MEIARLLDRAHYGLGIAARHIGDDTDAYRPSGRSEPLAKDNRFLRLRAAFIPRSGSTRRPSSYGAVEWNGIFDASYTKPGDYLVLNKQIFFIVAQQALLPVLCVLTNRVITIMRPGIQTGIANVPYSGYISSNNSIIMEGWPASVLGITGRGEPAARLPNDQATPYVAILLPTAASVLISPGDLVNDDLGRNSIITGSELTDLGWRLTAKMATN